MDAQLKKGILDLCTLKLLSEKPDYGYSLIQGLKKLFPDVNDSTFYAVLRRLNAEGALTIKEGNESGGPVRKYYYITEFGREVLANSILEWRDLVAALKSIGI